MSKEQDAGRCRPAPTSRGLSGIVSIQYVEKHYDSRQAGMTTFYDFIILNFSLKLQGSFDMHPRGKVRFLALPLATRGISRTAAFFRQDFSCHLSCVPMQAIEAYGAGSGVVYFTRYCIVPERS